MKWYSAVVLYSEYQKTLATFTAPYGMLPAGVYRVDESSNTAHLKRLRYRQQAEQGIRLAENYYLRLFPVWLGNGLQRGNNTIILSKAKALSAAARLRDDPELANLCRVQLQWVLGRNPFSQSTMYGEGYDYPPLYAALSGNMVGALPVGIQTRLNRVEKAIDLIVSQEPAGDGRVTIRTKVECTGCVRLTVRAHNLEVDRTKQEVKLEAGKPQTVTWTAQLLSTKEPWVAVIVPNGNLLEKKELIGGLPH